MRGGSWSVKTVVEHTPFAARCGIEPTGIAPAARMVDAAATVGYPDCGKIEYDFFTRNREFFIEVPQRNWASRVSTHKEAAQVVDGPSSKDLKKEVDVAANILKAAPFLHTSHGKTDQDYRGRKGKKMSSENQKHRVLERALNFTNSSHSFSRREFLIMTGGIIVAVSALEARGAKEAPLIILDQAAGLVIADATRCVGCRRCELACTEFNDGKASPTMARIKIGRNLNFGPKGAYAGLRAQGNWGNGLIIQELCKQCPHPVPCANACPNDAIVVSLSTNARVVDPNKCTGCKMCQRACPWEMMSFDSDTDKATKCFLCEGSPKCVEACPSGALSYIAWRDLTEKVPPRVVPTAVVSPEKAQACIDCHKK